LTLAAASALAALAAACVQAQGATPSGASLFAAKCALCHGPNGPGANILAVRMDPAVAELTRREDLPADYVRLVVRNGLGNMPPFTRVDITDAELEVVAAYLARADAN
jgi:mono/diheme cytochrome c family protein